ncbi:MAG: hypothetical protein ACFE0I_17110 [Elainellaceae cyanobacterium]
MAKNSVFVKEIQPYFGLLERFNGIVGRSLVKLKGALKGRSH